VRKANEVTRHDPNGTAASRSERTGRRPGRRCYPAGSAFIRTCGSRGKAGRHNGRQGAEGGGGGAGRSRG
jgi:hypothetical protein